MNYNRNRIHNITNPYQGRAPKVLCVCSAGLLRSPTMALTLATEYGFNTRAVGYSLEYALIPLEEILIYWADEIVVAYMSSFTAVMQMIEKCGENSQFDTPTCPVINLNIPDEFAYNATELIKIIKDRYLSQIGAKAKENEE